MRYFILILCLLFNGCEKEISGCTDTDACNYNIDATKDDNSCFYEQENFDCNGICNVEIDCNGECGGVSIDTDNDGLCDDIDDCIGQYDDCGVCDGDGIDTDQDGLCDDIDDCIGGYDECGICNGDGIADGECDCDGNVLDACGVCNGIIDDCFSYNVSSQLSYYFFENVLIDSNEIDTSDWVGAFKGDVCVGSRKWTCNGTCDVPVYGEGDLDLNPLTEGYMLPGELPLFKIYDASENMYYDASPSEQIPWQQLGTPVIESLISQ